MNFKWRQVQSTEIIRSSLSRTAQARPCFKQNKTPHGGIHLYTNIWRLWLGDAFSFRPQWGYLVRHCPRKPETDRQKDRYRKTERQRKAEFRVSFNSTYALNQPQTYTNSCVQFRKSKVQCSPMVQASNPKATRVVTFKTRVLQL